MGTITTTNCDVFGTIKDIKKYRIHMYKCDSAGNKMEGNAPDDLDRKHDLSPAAVKRLVKFISRGCSPPKRKKGP